MSNVKLDGNIINNIDTVQLEDADNAGQYISFSNKSSLGLNIEYGDAAPTNTSKLWIKSAKPTKIMITPNVDGAGTITSGVGALPTGAYGIACAAVGTKIYLFGGYGVSYLNTINVFDTVTNGITTLSTTLPTATNFMACAAVGTKIYLFGGDGSSRLNTINRFNVSLALDSGNILITPNMLNVFNLIYSADTQVQIGVLNVYKGDSNNEAGLVDAYLHNGTDWVNVNTGATLT